MLNSLYLLISHHLSLLPSPPGAHLVCSLCMSLFVFLLYSLVGYIFRIPHINDIMQDLSFSDWLISFSITPCKPIYVVASGKTPFSFFDWAVFHCIKIPYLLYMWYVYTTSSSVDGYLGWFHILAIENNAAMNGEHGFFQISVFIFFSYIPRSMYHTCHMVAPFLGFKNPPYCFPQWLYQFTFRQQWTVLEGPSVFTSLTTFFFCGVVVFSSVVKNLPASAGDVGLIYGSGKSPGEWNGNLLQ